VISDLSKSLYPLACVNNLTESFLSNDSKSDTLIFLIISLVSPLALIISLALSVMYQYTAL
jgi:hypothetical protein